MVELLNLRENKEKEHSSSDCLCKVSPLLGEWENLMGELCHAETWLVCSRYSDCEDGACAKTSGKNSDGVDMTWCTALPHLNTWNQAKTQHKFEKISLTIVN